MAGPTAPPSGLCLVGVRYPPAALGEMGDEATALGEAIGQVPFAGQPGVAGHSGDIESQWRQDETPDDARSTR